MSEFCVLLISSFFWQHKVNMKVEKDGKKIALLVGCHKPRQGLPLVVGWCMVE